jgi:RimJ/RimL family protein N-acetyltransferase
MPATDITYRLAKEADRSLFFEWANEESVRENSFSPCKIEWDDHCNWYSTKLGSHKSFLFVFFSELHAVGQLRFDRTDDEVLLIDYSVDKEWRGKHLGQQILHEAKIIANKLFPSLVLKGIVQNKNTASIIAFERAGFIKMNEELVNNITCTIFNSN